MPSSIEKKQGTFTERYILPYSLLAFYGVVNENAAQQQGIKLTEEDILLMLEGIWNGTKNLISGSKFGQMPRLLMQVIYKAGDFYIGELDKCISLITDKNHEAIRDIADVKIDVTNLIKSLNEHKEKIKKVRFKADKRLVFIKDGNDIAVKNALSNFVIEELEF